MPDIAVRLPGGLLVLPRPARRQGELDAWPETRAASSVIAAFFVGVGDHTWRAANGEVDLPWSQRRGSHPRARNGTMNYCLASPPGARCLHRAGGEASQRQPDAKSVVAAIGRGRAGRTSRTGVAVNLRDAMPVSRTNRDN